MANQNSTFLRRRKTVKEVLSTPKCLDRKNKFSSGRFFVNDLCSKIKNKNFKKKDYLNLSDCRSSRKAILETKRLKYARKFRGNVVKKRAKRSINEPPKVNWRTTFKESRLTSEKNIITRVSRNTHQSYEEQRENCALYESLSTPLNEEQRARLKHFASKLRSIQGYERRQNVHVVETGLTVVVKDINDNPPIFPNTTIYAQVQENGPVGT